MKIQSLNIWSKHITAASQYEGRCMVTFCTSCVILASEKDVKLDEVGKWSVLIGSCSWTRTWDWNMMLSVPRTNKRVSKIIILTNYAVVVLEYLSAKQKTLFNWVKLIWAPIHRVDRYSVVMNLSIHHRLFRKWWRFLNGLYLSQMQFAYIFARYSDWTSLFEFMLKTFYLSNSTQIIQIFLSKHCFIVSTDFTNYLFTISRWFMGSTRFDDVGFVLPKARILIKSLNL